MKSNNPLMKLLAYHIDSHVCAFSTERSLKSGEEPTPYTSFNITHYCGDTPEHVAQCRKTLCSELGIEDRHLFLPRQTHGIHICRVGSSTSLEELEDTDALITGEKGICIGVSTADCIPILLYDTEKKASAAIHAGWRGTAKRIAEKTIEQMKAAFGSQTRHLKAVIGPGISLDAFEVGDEVYAAFQEAGFPMQQIAKQYRKWHIDLWAANYLQLENMGIPLENIKVAGICTYSASDRFFSARQLGIQSGRIFTGIMMK